MPHYPPPRRMRSDNIKRWPARNRKRVAAMLDVLTQMKGGSGPWMERDPDDAEAWWRAVALDPRAQQTRMERIPASHPDRSLRLDRCPQPIVTVRCANCKVEAVYETADLVKSFGTDRNIRRLPEYLLPCPSKRDRREGVCDLKAEPGGYTAHVRSVKAAGSFL